MARRVSDDEIWAKRTEKAKRSGVGAWSRAQLARHEARRKARAGVLRREDLDRRLGPRIATRDCQ